MCFLTPGVYVSWTIGAVRGGEECGTLVIYPFHQHGPLDLGAPDADGVRTFISECKQAIDQSCIAVEGIERLNGGLM